MYATVMHAVESTSMCITCNTMLLYPNNAHYIGTFNMKALTFILATQIVCDSTQGDVGFCRILVILLEEFFPPTLLTWFFHKKNFYTLVCTLFCT